MPGYVLGGRIDPGERLDLIQIGVVKRGDDGFDRGFQGVEIAQQAVGVEMGSGDDDGEAPVVAVQRLAPPREDQRMGRREHALHTEFKHGRIVAPAGAQADVGDAPSLPRWRVGLVVAKRPSSAHRGGDATTLRLAAYPPLVMSTHHESTLMLSVSGARGLVGTSMTPEVAANLARAFGEDLRQCVGAGGIVVVGRDGRPSGAALEAAACATLASMGFHIVRLGIVMTPTTAVMIDHLGAVGGIVITASHNPIEWNGLKFLTRQGAAPPRAEAQRIIDRFRAAKDDRAKPQVAGAASSDDSGPESHIERVLALIDAEPIRVRRFKVVLDSVNGAGCVAGRLLLERLGAEVIHLNGQPTGVFAHTPEPVRENLTDLAAQVARDGADVGFAQDPDADRLAIVDERGRYIGEEYTFALAAEEILSSESPGRGKDRAVAVNLSSSRMIDDVAARHGARVIRTPVGEANVVEAMKRHRCIAGGEGNGGIIWPKVCLVRDSLSGMALVLSLLARRGEALSRIVDEMPSYAIEKAKTPIRPGLAERAINALAERYPEAAQDRQDGLRIDWPEQGAWLHVRASNTEPILRLISEAKDEQCARAILSEATGLIGAL